MLEGFAGCAVAQPEFLKPVQRHDTRHESQQDSQPADGQLEVGGVFLDWNEASQERDQAGGQNLDGPESLVPALVPLAFLAVPGDLVVQAANEVLLLIHRDHSILQ